MSSRIHEILIPLDTAEFEREVPAPGECFAVEHSLTRDQTGALFVLGDDGYKRTAKFVWLCAEDKMPADTGAFRYIGTLLIGDKHKHLIRILHVKENPNVDAGA